MKSKDEDALLGQVASMRDDPDAWGDPVLAPKRSKSEQRQRGAVVSVRFTPDELLQVQERAAQHHQTVSGYLRAVGLANSTPAPTSSSASWTGQAAFNSSRTTEALMIRHESPARVANTV